MDLSTAAARLGIALCLGLLVGLDRQRVNHPLGGLRTFAMIAVFGALCGLLGQQLGPWLVPTGLLCAVAALIAGVWRIGAQVDGPQLTTVFAALIMYGVGALVVLGDPVIGIVIAGALTVLLHAKDRLHRLVAGLGREDVTAVMQFVLITLVILPILPNRTFGPYQVFNPREAWLLVVLIVSIGLGGYTAFKLMGPRAGTLLGAILGGLISSTATTVSYARRTAAGQGVGLAAMAIMLASAVSAIRVIGIIAVVAPGQSGTFWPPLALLAGLMLATAAVLWFTARDEHAGTTEHSNPAQLGTALIFAGMYGVVLIGVAWARDTLGSGAIYGVAAASGATDMDAIALSTARLVERAQLDPAVAWRAVVIGLMANAVFKAGSAWFLGSRRLGVLVGALFGMVVLAGALLIWFWPA
jgi:uncharacterized membrane protein (DUF4010 family)